MGAHAGAASEDAGEVLEDAEGFVAEVGPGEGAEGEEGGGLGEAVAAAAEAGDEAVEEVAEVGRRGGGGGGRGGTERRRRRKRRDGEGVVWVVGGELTVIGEGGDVIRGGVQLYELQKVSDAVRI